MKDTFKLAYMDVAKRFAQESHAIRNKVGAILVKDDTIISIGINGTPSGWDNNCENEQDGVLTTKPEVLHAELNCLSKIAKSSQSSDNAIMFITLSPCYDCAKQIYTAGIKEVYYAETYRNTNGLEFLKQCGVRVEKI